MEIRKHETHPDIQRIFDRLDRASPAGKILGQLIEGLLAGQLEYASPWDDLRFPATSINPVGQASPPGTDPETGLLLFDAGLTEIVGITAQMPHSWKEGTDIIPHLHWQKTTSAAGSVYWQLEYKWAPIGEVMDATWTTLPIVETPIPDNDIADTHAISSFGHVSTEGRQISDMLVMKLSRVGGNVGIRTELMRVCLSLTSTTKWMALVALQSFAKTSWMTCGRVA